MALTSETIVRAARFAGEVVAETLWPTRCALCDEPGAVLCEHCAATLPFVDTWKACPRCGSAFGKAQCDRCNPVKLEWIGRRGFPFSACASATTFSDGTGRIVRTFKDQGERRLAATMARLMARYVAPGWSFDAVTFVPASKPAFRRRGFDHAELLACEIASLLQVSLAATLARPASRDQRQLGGRDRVANLNKAFSALDGAVCGRRYLLIDDVLTTGSTLCSATDALLAADAVEVFCLTFAGV